MYPDVQVCMNGITSAYLKMKSAYLIAIYMNMYPDSQVCNNEIGSPVQSRVAEIFLQSDPDMHVNIEERKLDPVYRQISGNTCGICNYPILCIEQLA